MIRFSANYLAEYLCDDLRGNEVRSQNLSRACNYAVAVSFGAQDMINKLAHSAVQIPQFILRGTYISERTLT